MRFFTDCRGAIDSTHLFLSIKSADRRTSGAEVWRNRKNWYSQNVLAVADFKMNFIFVHAGWEGSAHDATVLRDAQKKGLIRLPPGKYFVADAGYCDKGGYDGLVLSPYQATRYHLKEWAHSKDKPKTKEELFNLRHTKLRNVVERIFGVFKARFHIFDKARDGYSIDTQVKLVYALTGVHNFINSYKETDADLEWARLSPGVRKQYDRQQIKEDASTQISKQYNNELRDTIAELNWASYLEYHAEFEDT